MSSKISLKSMRHWRLIGMVVLMALLTPGLAMAQLVVDGGATIYVPSDIRYGSETIGDTGQGTLNQTGGTNITELLTLGKQTTGNGTYNLSDGNIHSVNYSPRMNITIIGDAGQGIFNQTGGTHSTSEFYLGKQDTGIGTYNLEQGILSVSISEQRTGAVEVIGNYGSGTFTQTNGDNYANNIYVGRYPGSSGIYTQNGGNTETLNLYLADQSGSSGIYELRNGSLKVDYQEWIGKSGAATFTQSGGTHTIGSNGLSLGSSSTYSLSGDGSLFVGVGGYLGIDGTFTQTGGSVNINIANLSVGGTYNLEGGTLEGAPGNIGVSGTFNIKGVNLTLPNAPVFNGGTIKTTNATHIWGQDYMEGFTNSGAYLSNQSNQTFEDLKINPTGYIAAASQDMFIIKLDFENRSTQSIKWNTAKAMLKFVEGWDPWVGVDTTHDLYIPGVDLGHNMAGYADNFAWGTLNIEGQTVHLFDGNTTNSGTALYVNEILGVDCSLETLMVMNIIGDGGLNIYYNPFMEGNDYLEGKTFILRGDGTSRLIPTPVPGSVLLLGSGLLGLAGWRRFRKG